MSSEAVREPVEGDGHAIASLEGRGEGYGFAKIRQALETARLGVAAPVGA